MTIKVKRVRFSKPVPALTTTERIRRERDQLDLLDVGDDGFRLGEHGVSYAGPDGSRYLVPWAHVRWCEVEDAPGRRRRGAADGDSTTE